MHDKGSQRGRNEAVVCWRIAAWNADNSLEASYQSTNWAMTAPCARYVGPDTCSLSSQHGLICLYTSCTRPVCWKQSDILRALCAAAQSPMLRTAVECKYTRYLRRYIMLWCFFAMLNSRCRMNFSWYWRHYSFWLSKCGSTTKLNRNAVHTRTARAAAQDSAATFSTESDEMDSGVTAEEGDSDHLHDPN